MVEVRPGGVPVASVARPLIEGSDFGIPAAEVAGVGVAAAINQNRAIDGTGNPAKWGSEVAVFGTGPLPASLDVRLGGVNNNYSYVGSVPVDYAGPAPGLVPGVKSINFRLPKVDCPAGWLSIWEQPIMILISPPKRHAAHRLVPDRDHVEQRRTALEVARFESRLTTRLLYAGLSRRTDTTLNSYLRERRAPHPAGPTRRTDSW